ncbi:helix-turn-helix domain-containing protein [Parahaliea maris]|uniref:HTH-type transcriptional repressor AllR n=1 Tax=Parahaliea maris TaxID=2716870 RepID=A0A5C8ZPU0_9GAMM|nr:helix-turn-helix domain-containing protein [Parahaliea maris]
MTSLSHSGISNPTIRMLSVLSLVTVASPRKMGLTELSDRLGMPKATCSLVVSQLWSAGYLDRDAGSRQYGIGPRAAFMPALGLVENERDTKLHDGLTRLGKRIGMPLSLIQQSTRSAVVVSTYDPCSELAKLGRRRPLVAPFGASLFAFASDE